VRQELSPMVPFAKIQAGGYVEPLIALIDDDASFRTALFESLCSLGYRVHGFASAEEFVAVGEASIYDCVITDIHMPGMSGLDLKKLLNSRGSRVPVIMVTARGEAGLEAMAMAGGAVCLLRKPFQTNTLVDFLQRSIKV
jgi:FixJ family two-component response regulator